MTQLSPDLARLGSALEDAARADLRAPRRRRTRRLVLLAAALAVAIPGVAIGAKLLTGTDAVAQSLPAGTAMLAGTDPVCTVIAADVEYHCILQHRPVPEVTDSAGNAALKGTVEPTVDATRHVNGGCRSLRADGLEWECYLGRAAVDQQIISLGFLGAYAPSPGRG